LYKRVILSLIKDNLVTCAHDCSKGGLAIALCEMALAGRTGVEVDLDLLPNTCSRIDNLLFSESHSRFIVATSEPTKVEESLKSTPGLLYAEIGNTLCRGDNQIVFVKSGSPILCSSIKELESKYDSLCKTMS
jgi:phosphoribosylformylglycinamidine (FGAM) synthase-like enzyme